MGELFQKKPRQAGSINKADLSTNPPDAAVPDTAGVQSDIDKALGRVKIMYGAQEISCDIAGKTVAYAREQLSTLLNIPPDAEAIVNNEAISGESVVLSHNAIVEFIKSSGQKGNLEIFRNGSV